MRLASVRGFDRPVYAVAAGYLLNTFGSGVVYPFATIHFHLEVGIPFGLVGLGLLANNVGTAVGTAAGGYLADRRGRKPVVVASMALAAPTLAAYALVRSAPVFIAVATAAGLALGLYAPAAQAMVADLVPGPDRDRAFAMLKVASNAGFGLGFVAGGVLYALSHLAVFVVDGLTSGLVAVGLALALPRTVGAGAGTGTGSGAGDGAGDAVGTRESLARWGRAVTRPRVLALAGLNVGFAVMYAQMGATVPVFATEALGLTSEQVGTLWVLNPLVIVTLQLPLVAKVDGWRRTRGVVLSAAFWAASFLAVAAAELRGGLLGVGLVGAFLVLRTVGEILHAPLITSLASDVGGAGERGSHLSTLEIAKRLGFGLGATLGGVFFDAGARALLWPTLAAVCLGLALGALAIERSVSPAENGVPAAGD